MDILDRINWNLADKDYDVSVLTGTLTIVFKVEISNEQLKYSKQDRQLLILEQAKKQIKTNISNCVFDEVINMLKIEANDLIKASLKCTDYSDSELMRESARRLLLMVSKMECPNNE